MKQIGVFIIWQFGENYAQDIIEDISEKFSIIEVNTIQWEKKNVGINLNKLYPHREFDYKSAKVKEIGADKNGVRLHVIIISDDRVNLKDNINLNLKDLKEIYRKKYNTNFLHSSDNEEEAIDNIKQVLEYENNKIENIINTNANKFVLFNHYKKIVMMEEKINFNSIIDVFNLLENKGIMWVVLRNWDELDNDIVSLEHGDVDILVDDFYKTILILNAKRGTKINYRVQYRVQIDNRDIPFDIRHIGDDYYDKKWEDNILKDREKLDYFYIPNKSNYYYSLLYHAILHKERLSADYSSKLLNLKEEAPTLKNLKIFLNKNNYSITRPKDKSVYYRYSKRHYINITKQFIKKSKIMRGLITWIKK